MPTNNNNNNNNNNSDDEIIRFDLLPLEILTYLLDYLDLYSLLALGKVNKHLNFVCNQDHLRWRKRIEDEYQSDYDLPPKGSKNFNYKKLYLQLNNLQAIDDLLNDTNKYMEVTKLLELASIQIEQFNFNTSGNNDLGKLLINTYDRAQHDFSFACYLIYKRNVTNRALLRCLLIAHSRNFKELDVSGPAFYNNSANSGAAPILFSLSKVDHSSLETLTLPACIFNKVEDHDFNQFLLVLPRFTELKVLRINNPDNLVLDIQAIHDLTNKFNDTLQRIVVINGNGKETVIGGIEHINKLFWQLDQTLSDEKNKELKQKIIENAINSTDEEVDDMDYFGNEGSDTEEVNDIEYSSSEDTNRNDYSPNKRSKY